MNYVYVVLRHDREPDELAFMQAWTEKEAAEAATEKLLKIIGCLQTAVEVRCIACS